MLHHYGRLTVRRIFSTQYSVTRCICQVQSSLQQLAPNSLVTPVTNKGSRVQPLEAARNFKRGVCSGNNSSDSASASQSKLTTQGPYRSLALTERSVGPTHLSPDQEHDESDTQLLDQGGPDVAGCGIKRRAGREGCWQGQATQVTQKNPQLHSLRQND